MISSANLSSNITPEKRGSTRELAKGSVREILFSERASVTKRKRVVFKDARNKTYRILGLDPLTTFISVYQIF